VVTAAQVEVVMVVMATKYMEAQTEALTALLAQLILVVAVEHRVMEELRLREVQVLSSSVMPILLRRQHQPLALQQ